MTTSCDLQCVQRMYVCFCAHVCVYLSVLLRFSVHGCICVRMYLCSKIPPNFVKNFLKSFWSANPSQFVRKHDHPFALSLEYLALETQKNNSEDVKMLPKCTADWYLFCVLEMTLVEEAPRRRKITGLLLIPSRNCLLSHHRLVPQKRVERKITGSSSSTNLRNTCAKMSESHRRKSSEDRAPHGGERRADLARKRHFCFFANTAPCLFAFACLSKTKGEGGGGGG